MEKPRLKSPRIPAGTIFLVFRNRIKNTAESATVVPRAIGRLDFCNLVKITFTIIPFLLDLLSIKPLQ
jgi:hypothetical protein